MADINELRLARDQQERFKWRANQRVEELTVALERVLAMTEYARASPSVAGQVHRLLAALSTAPGAVEERT